MTIEYEKRAYETHKKDNFLREGEFTDEKAMQMFSEDPFAVTFWLGKNPTFSKKFLKFVFKQRYKVDPALYLQLIVGITQSANTSTKILEKIFEEDKEASFHEFLASSPNLNVGLAEKIYEARATRGHYSLALNTKTPSHILNELGTGGTTTIKANVATNTSATPELLRFIYKNLSDSSFDILKGIAGNINTPVDMLVDIYNTHIKEALKDIGDDPLKEVSYPKILIDKIALNSSTPKKILKEIANTSNLYFSLSLANNKSTPKSVLKKIGEDNLDQAFSYKGSHLYYNLVRNKSTPMSALENIAHNGLLSNRFLLKKNTEEALKGIPFESIILDFNFKEEYTPEVIKFCIRNCKISSFVFDICQLSTAKLEDILYALYYFKDNKDFIFYVLDEESHCYPEFKVYFKNMTGMNLTDVPEDMIFDLMGWNV
jgi:hypothetical protein